jgi:hypothetical protein
MDWADAVATTAESSTTGRRNLSTDPPQRLLRVKRSNLDRRALAQADRDCFALRIPRNDGASYLRPLPSAGRDPPRCGSTRNVGGTLSPDFPGSMPLYREGPAASVPKIIRDSRFGVFSVLVRCVLYDWLAATFHSLRHSATS